MLIDIFLALLGLAMVASWERVDRTAARIMWVLLASLLLVNAHYGFWLRSLLGA